MKEESERNRDTGTRYVPSNVLRPAAAIALLLASFPVGPCSPAAAQTRPAQNQAAPGAQNALAGNAQKGKDAFAAHMCATCHGPEGQGAVGPVLAPPPRAFGDFTRYVRQPAGKMPPFTPQAVPDTDLADIYTFLQSANPAPRSNLSALTGNGQNGGRIYVSLSLIHI